MRTLSQLRTVSCWFANCVRWPVSQESMVCTGVPLTAVQYNIRHHTVLSVASRVSKSFTLQDRTGCPNTKPLYTQLGTPRLLPAISVETERTHTIEKSTATHCVRTRIIRSITCINPSFHERLCEYELPGMILNRQDVVTQDGKGRTAVHSSVHLHSVLTVCCRASQGPQRKTQHPHERPGDLPPSMVTPW